MVPRDAQTILSMGCGSGATRNDLKQRGARVTVLPLNSVVGAANARLGLEVIYGSMAECFNRLGKRRIRLCSDHRSAPFAPRSLAGIGPMRPTGCQDRNAGR